MLPGGLRIGGPTTTLIHCSFHKTTRGSKLTPPRHPPSAAASRGGDGGGGDSSGSGNDGGAIPINTGGPVLPPAAADGNNNDTAAATASQQHPRAVADRLWAPAITAPLPALLQRREAGAAGAAGAAERAAADRAFAAANWRNAYASVAADAVALGLPASAVPRLPDDDAELTLEVVQEKQALLQDIVASFLSSGL